jgi:hypothetical protein
MTPIKYRILGFDLIAKVLATLTPRMAASLKYNRCLNMNGGTGNNIACDMALEFLNKKCKENLSHSAVITENVLKRVGNSIGPLTTIQENIDHELNFYSNIGKRVHPTYSKEIGDFAVELKKYDLLKQIPGRCHQAFLNFPKNKINTLNGQKLNDWLTRRKEVLAKEERLRYFKS